jgi:hypothetical protein
MAVSASVVILALIALAPIYSWLAIFTCFYAGCLSIALRVHSEMGGVFRRGFFQRRSHPLGQPVLAGVVLAGLAISAGSCFAYPSISVQRWVSYTPPVLVLVALPAHSHGRH